MTALGLSILLFGCQGDPSHEDALDGQGGAAGDAGRDTTGSGRAGTTARTGSGGASSSSQGGASGRGGDTSSSPTSRQSGGSNVDGGGTSSGGGGSSGQGGISTGRGGTSSNLGGASNQGGAGGASASDAGAGGDAGATSSGEVRMIDASHVRLLSGSPFYDRQELHRKGYVASLSADKLLYEYRALAKVTQAGGVTAGYGGWDTSFLKGHMLGHYLSAVSRMAAATGDDTFATKSSYVVSELAKCQTALGANGYLSAFPSTVFDWLEGKSVSNGGIVVPYYTVHKIMAGLLDAYHYLGNQQALDVVTKMADYFQARLAALSADTLETIFRTDGNSNPQNEYGAMSDVYAELSSITGEKKYLDTAKLFNRSWFMAPLASGQDNLKGLHGNCHIAQALGIAHTANLSGDATSLQASEAFWKLLTHEHAFVNGGDSFHEWLDKSGVEAGASIDSGAVLPSTTAETCNTHNMLKLTNVLFVRKPDVGYAEYYERALYNHVLASLASDTGYPTYFTPLHGHFRTYIDATFCDNGTGIEATPRFNEGIYFEQGSSVWINQYIPNELTWEATGLTLHQEGYAAVGEAVRITVSKAAAPVPATLYLRIPSWVSDDPVLTVNGAAQNQSLDAGTYLPLSRTWSVGDVVTLTLPAALRLERSKDVSSMVSLFYGPLLLAGELGNASMPTDTADKDAYLSTAAATVPTIKASADDLAAWLTRTSGTTLAFKSQNAGDASGITFRPLYDVHHERYSVYWTLQSN